MDDDEEVQKSPESTYATMLQWQCALQLASMSYCMELQAWAMQNSAMHDDTMKAAFQLEALRTSPVTLRTRKVVDGVGENREVRDPGTLQQSPVKKSTSSTQACKSRKGKKLKASKRLNSPKKRLQRRAASSTADGRSSFRSPARSPTTRRNQMRAKTITAETDRLIKSRSHNQLKVGQEVSCVFATFNKFAHAHACRLYSSTVRIFKSDPQKSLVRLPS